MVVAEQPCFPCREPLLRLRSLVMVDEDYHSGDLFDWAIRQIEAGYSTHGLGLGWRFLLSPRNTLSNRAPLWLMGLNPGGNLWEENSPCVEHGTAFYREYWDGNNRYDKLQEQVQSLFHHLADSLGEEPQSLSARCLCSNIIPFRTRSEQELLHYNRKDTRRYAHNLWGRIIRELRPTVIVCYHQFTFSCMTQIHRRYLTQVNNQSEPTGWGKDKKRQYPWEVRDYCNGSYCTSIFRVPHLSRYTIFSSPQCGPYVEKFRQELIARLHTSMSL